MGKPIVVVLDDIDRLSSSEIREVFKLVRLTASFPNVIYMVAFDRSRVEQALAEQGVPGRDYLEKILQVSIDLPTIPPTVLTSEILSAVDSAVAGIEDSGPFDKQAWPDIFSEVIRPLVRNIRDVRRYAANVRGAVSSFDGEIALVDILALEAVRTFLPDVFDRLHGAFYGLTTPSELVIGRRDDPQHLKDQIDGLIEAAGINRQVVEAMIERVFPAAQRHIGRSHYGPDWKGRWFSGRRVAHGDVFEFYLERVPGQGLLTLKDAERAWGCMADQRAFDHFMRSLDVSRLQDVISSLEDYEDKFTPEHVEPGAVVLLNLLRDIPERRQGIFDFGPSLVVSRVVIRLLRSLNDEPKVESAVRRVLPQLNSISAKLELIDDVGHRENVGHKLVSKAVAAELEEAWRDEVRSASVDELARENDLLRIFLVAKREADPNEESLTISDVPQLTLGLLRAANTEALSQSVGSRAVRRSPRLAWDALIELYGDEATLNARIDRLKQSGFPDAKLLEFTDRYLQGWRPKD